MALFHLSVTQTKRSAGQSAIASAAYRAGERLYSEYYGEYSDYTRKGGVICSDILLPSHAPPEYADRQTLWNAVEKAERGKNAQLAYSFDIALQNEFSLEENIALARQFLLENFVSRGMVVDFAVHQPDREDGGIPNPHFHVLCPTHEAIIDKETFEIVQKIRAGKRRPTRMGEMPMFSGLLYCADCGSKLTFHRKADEPAEKHHYICGNYRSNTSNCTMHYIRNVVVERIVLENLKEVIRYVSNYEDEFVRMVMDADVRQKNRELAQKKKKLIELQKRIGELDTIFQRIYEDNITGKLSDERFMKMSKGYEDEQHTLQAEADKIQNELQQEEKKSVDVKRFLAIVKKYTDLTELTPEILREFVDKIIVHAPDKSSGRRLQEIEIIYNHIGEFDHSKVTLWKGNAV